ncbi:unnamed protein product, partial [Brenthis ino]
MRTEHLDQASFCPFAPREVSVLAELALGHLRYSLTDVPPQSNSPPGSVLEPDHAGVVWRRALPPRRHSARLERNTNRADRARDETDAALRLGRSAEGRNAGPDSARNALRPRRYASPVTGTRTHEAHTRTSIDQARHRPHPLPVQTRHAPVLRANPYSKVTDPICRLPLPTLFYRLEALHLGDLLRIWVRTGATSPRTSLT